MPDITDSPIAAMIMLRKHNITLTSVILNTLTYNAHNDNTDISLNSSIIRLKLGNGKRRATTNAAIKLYGDSFTVAFLI
jgi:hypothetical protein